MAMIPFLEGIQVTGDSEFKGNVDIDGNLSISGTVDGVDVSDFKQEFDGHNHDGAYVTEAELNAHNHDSEYLSLNGGTLNGDLDVDGKIHDIDGSDADRNVSDVLDMLLKMQPAAFEFMTANTIESPLYEGRAADGSAHNYVYTNEAIGDDLTTISFGDVFQHVGTDVEFSYANTGVIRLIVNNMLQGEANMSDYSPDGSPGTAAPSSGYPPEGISVSALTKHVNYSGTAWFDVPPQFTLGALNITVDQSYMQNGSNTVRIEHWDGNQMLASTEAQFFLDSSETVITLSHTSIIIDAAANQSELSGVPYVGNNTTVQVQYRSNNFFGGSYPITAVFNFINEDLGISTAYTFSDGEAYTTPNPVVDEAVVQNEILTINAPAKLYDPNVGVTVQTLSNNTDRNSEAQLIQSSQRIRGLFGLSESTDSYEDFFSEVYRIPDVSAYENDFMNNLPTGLFNSSAILAADALQVIPENLVYPKDDFTITLPAGPDYSLLNGERIYVRALSGFNVAEAGGILTMPGIDYTDISEGRVSIEIRMPGLSAWGTLSSEYLEPVTVNGSGCWYRAAGDGTDGVFGFFMGHTFSDGGSANAILLRIKIAESAKNIISIGSITAEPLS